MTLSGAVCYDCTEAVISGLHPALALVVVSTLMSLLDQDSLHMCIIGAARSHISEKEGAVIWVNVRHSFW